MQFCKAIFIIALALTIPTMAEQADSGDLSQYYGFGPIEIIKLDWGTKGLNVADFNGDGRNDIAIVNNIKARIELLIQKESIGPDDTEVAIDPRDIDVNAITPPTRFARQSIAVSQRIYSLVCGDFNSDRLPDLAFYGEPKGLYILLQTADRTAADKKDSLNWETRKKINIEDGLVTTSVLACGDLNGDGKDDLALAGRDGVYIVCQEKDGSLAEPVKYPISATTLSVEIGDLDGDGINDLVLVTSDTEKPVHVRFGLKTGQLGPQLRFFIERPFRTKLQNIDATAGSEILTVDSLSGRLICYKLDTENRKDADWPALYYPLTSGPEDTKRDLAVGDFNGDRLLDVAISDPGAAEIILYKQTRGIGLTEPVRFPAFSDITSLSAADINHDGKSELAVLSVKEKVIGISEFEDDRLQFPRPAELVGEPVAMELADIDDDGEPDCIYVAKDEKDKMSLRAIYNLAAAQKQQGDEQKDELTPLEKLTSNPDGLKVLDADQDGLQDVLIFVNYEPPVLVRQVEKGKFEIVDSPNAQSSLIKDASLRSIAAADVDGKKGLELLIAQKNFARSLVFAEGRTWAIIDQYNASSTDNQISAVAAFDIQGVSAPERPAILLLDGQKGQLQVLKAASDKTYRVEKELDVGNWNSVTHLKMLFAPFTGGRTESLLLFDSKKFAIVTPPRDGAGEHLKQQFSYETKIKDGTYGNLTAGDINSDGRTDIIMVDHRRNHIEILTLDADGEPVAAMRFKIFEEKGYRESKPRPKAAVEPRELTVADVTGDGKNDLITVIHDRIIIYPQD